MKLYNTLTRKLEEFIPINQNKVGIYSCGPTVYWNQHIGNMFAYIHWDILVKYLKYRGYDVSWVMNITDVGHMTSDGDTGEDKMEKGAKREGLTPWQIADKYIKQFLQSLDLLGIRKPDVLCRATENINEQIELIKIIEKKGFTYKTKTGLVFDTSKFPNYAKFANLDLSKQNSGARVEIDPEKKKPWDFLLWVTNQPNHIMVWDSPWGKGFPGWHIECTAMSTKYLGKKFDIHTGGIEHIPVHHTNEMAQSFGAFEDSLANYWLHNGWLLIDGKKVSKSLGNTILVTDFIEKGYDPIAFRYLVLNSHYRQGMNFTFESLNASKEAYKNLLSLVNNLSQTKADRTFLSDDKLEKIEYFKNLFIKSLDNDLNVPQALAVLWQVSKSNIPSCDKKDLILDFDQVLGLGLSEKNTNLQQKIPTKIKNLIDLRENFRKEKKWDEADKVRKEIEEFGYKIQDLKDTQKIIKKD